MAALAAERARLRPEQSYRIGANDLLEINVFDLPEMNRKERVATSGYIQLPLIGAVKAAGSSEAELAAEIAGRLGQKYLENPQVNVFVQEYKSQQVAVTGSVSRPGLYPLTRNRPTILDMISEAGGLTKDAGSMIRFIPANPSRKSAAFEAAGVAASLSDRPSVDTGLAEDAVNIDLATLLRRSDESRLNLQVVAGDVIFVPEAGSFTIEGWIEKPGTYPLTRETTVLAALSAGGGPLMPSNLSAVEILRSSSEGGGRMEVEVVDLKAIREGTAPNVRLHSGEVVRVPGYVALMVPWGIYSVIKGIFAVGAQLPLP